MPLQQSGSRAAIQSNIREMVAAGHKPSQAVAAAMRIKDQTEGKKEPKKK